ncbi:MAG: hypothetical protein ACXAD7_09990 [Candidatus Kariarchaeaceae archaeon]|jgi:hypothetical protein
MSFLYWFRLVLGTLIIVIGILLLAIQEYFGGAAAIIGGSLGFIFRNR